MPFFFPHNGTQMSTTGIICVPFKQAPIMTTPPCSPPPIFFLSFPTKSCTISNIILIFGNELRNPGKHVIKI